jgi:PAS domain S-box-containing protein
MSKMLATQEQRESVLQTAEASSQQTINVILLTLIFTSISLAVGMAIYFNTQAARRLSRVMGNIDSLSAGRHENLPLSGADEFARLDQHIHVMAAKLLEATHKERAVVENALDVIFSINTKGQFTAVNPAAEEIWGYGQATLLKMTISDLLEHENRREVINQLREAAISQKGCTLEAKTTAANGDQIEQLWSASWSKSEQTLFCVAHDIGARKRVERLKQEFVAMITHDLRTPLASIKAMLEVLAGPNSSLSPEWRENVRKSEQSSARLISLINDLLDLDKMQAGKLIIEPDVCLIDDLILSSIEAVQSFADSRKIAVSHQKSGLLVVVDERRLIQVIVNLLSNAIKFSPPDSIVSITTLASGKFVELRVSDHGPGIPTANQTGIFNRFEQVSASDDSVKGGSGLGLAICQEIIKVHGGQIGVESKEGDGSTFWLRLPSAE